MTQTIQSRMDARDILHVVEPPYGWVVVEDAPELTPAENAPQLLKEKLHDDLELAAKRVRDFICELKKVYGIDVVDSYLTIDGDLAYHIFFLFDKETYFSPKISAARLTAEKYVKSTSTVGMRFTFTIDEEYMKHHIHFNTYQLKRVIHPESNGTC